MKLHKMKQVDISPNMTVPELLDSMKNGGFTCRKVALATDLFLDMIKDESCTTFLGLAGALIPGGMRKILYKMIDNKMIDCIVTTGANLSHDLLETSGGSHFHGNNQLDGSKIKELDVSKIFDTFISFESFVKFENLVQKILDNIPNEPMSTRRFIYEIGRYVTDPNSIVRLAHEKEIPIFTPSFADSMLGVQSWLFSQIKPLKIDVLKDHTEFSELIYNSNKMGTLILGGGVPKHFIMNGSQLNDGLSYAIQITMDRPEHGGVSGASIKEAVSWGKVTSDAKWIDIMGDVTLVLPLLVTGVLSKL
ncbi:MAG: deoxyhypusine synthase [Candidatus Hodarchaeales archaeon]